MTPEVITTIVAVFGAVATLFSGVYVLNHRLETRLDHRLDKVDDRFDRVDEQFVRVDDRFFTSDARFEKFEAKLDGRFERIEEQLGVITADIVDLKVAVARLEGPRPTLLRTR